MGGCTLKVRETEGPGWSCPHASHVRESPRARSGALRSCETMLNGLDSGPSRVHALDCWRAIPTARPAAQIDRTRVRGRPRQAADQGRGEKRAAARGEGRAAARKRPRTAGAPRDVLHPDHAPPPGKTDTHFT
eukprot:3959971-Prymnesium_polylepis.3